MTGCETHDQDVLDTGFGQGSLAEGHDGGAALTEARARKQSIYVAYMCRLVA
jgi:hypothetical protein